MNYWKFNAEERRERAYIWKNEESARMKMDAYSRKIKKFLDIDTGETHRIMYDVVYLAERNGYAVRTAVVDNNGDVLFDSLHYWDDEDIEWQRDMRKLNGWI